MGFQRAVTGCLRSFCKKAALVVHGGTIMNILESFAITEKPFYQWHVDNGSGYRILLDPYLWRKGERSLHVTDRLPIY